MAKKTKITAPVEGFTGVGVGGLVFDDGVAETDNVAVIEYCRSAGYGVDDVKPTRKKPETPTPPVDARKAAKSSNQGTELRDAAVTPEPGDFMPPINAGQADPHGPTVVSPQVHASGPGDVTPGEVSDDPDTQETDETEHAEQALTERLDQAPGKNAKIEVWQQWGLQVESDQAAAADGEVPEDVRAKITGATRAELIKAYGPDES